MSSRVGVARLHRLMFGRRSSMLVTAPVIAALWVGICLGQIYQGPSGGYHGKPFDDWAASAGRTDLTELYLAQDGSGKILCFGAGYGRNTPNHKVYLHGGSCNKAALTYSFAPDEYVVGISGRFGSRVDSMQIYTNHVTQPYAGDKGGPAVFGYSAPHGQMIVAFTGRSDGELDAIGVMYAPCTPQKNPCH